MKKLKVVCTRDCWIEADTIGKLKAEIMYHFVLAEGELSQRLLVRDNRDLIRNSYPITGCVDLLQMPDESTLDGDDLCKDGDTLVLGWKHRPCIVRLVTDFVLEEGHNIKVDHSFTLGQLKRKIKRLTREPVTEENLPQVLFNEDDDGKPLLFFGYYSFWKKHRDPDFMIHRHKDNRPVSIYPITSRMLRDDNGNEFASYFYDDTPVKRRTENEEESYKKMNIEIGKRTIQSKENIENRKKKKKA